MRPAALLPALLALALAAPAGAMHQDQLVLGTGQASLVQYDGKGAPALACELPALVLAVKLGTIDVLLPLLARPLFLFAGGVGVGAPECAVTGLLSLRPAYIDSAEGSWALGWTFVAELDFDVLTLTTGPYGDGTAVPFTFVHTTISGTPVLRAEGTFADLAAGS